MLQRFQIIKNEFGNGALIRLLLLLIGLVGMTIIGILGFSSWVAVIIAVVGLISGFLLRKIIPAGAEYYSYVISAGLFIYGIILFLGDRFGIENNWKLAIISATTVIVFNLQFWTLSNPSVKKHHL